MEKLSFAFHWGIARNRVTRNPFEEGNTGIKSRFTGRLEDLDFADVLHYYQVQGSSSSRTIAYMANDDGLLFLGRRRAGAADRASWKSKFLASISTRRSGTDDDADDDGKYYIYWLVAGGNRPLARDIVLHPWARHLTLTVSLSQRGCING